MSTIETAAAVVEQFVSQQARFLSFIAARVEDRAAAEDILQADRKSVV